MPLPFEETALKFLERKPRTFIIYAACIGIGWVINRIIPDDCHREVDRWQSAYYIATRSRDSIQASKDILYEDLLRQKRADRHSDSLLMNLSRKASTVLKPFHHGHH